MAVDRGRITIPVPVPQVDQSQTFVRPIENNVLVVNIGQVTRAPVVVSDLTDIDLGAKPDGGVLEFDSQADKFILTTHLRRSVLDGGNF
jgi:hypothetical protein